MLDKIQQLKDEIQNLHVSSAAEVEDLRIKYLSKKGAISQLMNDFRTVAPELKRELGQKLNELKNMATDRINTLREEAAGSSEEKATGLDLTRTSAPLPLGSRHPLNIVRNKIIDIFARLGFSIAEGPEIEDDWHVFSSLNFAADHPARDMQDTFFIQRDPADVLLRTHTSSVQTRVMEHSQPPIRIICPGRVYRNEAISARAHCFFHQVEALYVDEHVSFADLKQTLLYFAREMFGPDTQIRLRPSYFPFTEPSAEMDISCNLCGGKGCAFCKHTGWVEILGCGMVDPNVLESCGIDSSRYSGFALGMGMAGAAWATVIGQTLSLAISAFYMARKTKTFDFGIDSFKPDMRKFGEAVKLGLSSLATQLTIVAIAVVCNVMLKKYGGQSAYGEDIPLAVIAIENKVFTVVINLTVGIALGCQPIISYNVGAKNYARVKKLFLYILLCTVAIGLVATLLFELAPLAVVGIFGAPKYSDPVLYKDFAVKTFRIFLMFVTFTCSVKMTSLFFQAAGKPARSILISCGARLAPFDIPQLREIMSYDEMELDKLGDKRTAAFFIISDTDSTYNFIVALAFSQMFNLLCERADNVHGGRLPHHVRVLWDEAANTGQVPNLEKLVAVIRSREVSLTLFYQQLAQCKAIYDKNAETILGNMDSVVFLGGREASTIKEISENWLGKATISMQTEGRSRGQSESYNQNTQRLGRELMTPAELATMPGDRCILQLRGLPPFYSKKYDLKQHPNYRYTAEADKKKNAFSLERLICRRIKKLNPNEQYTVYEADVPDGTPIDEDEDILNYDDLDDPDAFV